MNNKKLGNSFEENLALILADEGYWVSLFPPKTYSGS